MSLDTTLSPADVAALVEKSADWVERRVNAGEFEHLRVGRSMRFTTDQAETFIRSFTVRPDGEPGAEQAADPLRSQSSRSRNRRKSA
jgi:hypothetical protein